MIIQEEFLFCRRGEVIRLDVKTHTLVGVGLGVVDGLVLLVDDGVLGGLSAGAEAGVGVLGNVLVGLLLSSGTGALDGLRDVVGGVLCRARKALVIPLILTAP